MGNIRRDLKNQAQLTFVDKNRQVAVKQINMEKSSTSEKAAAMAAMAHVAIRNLRPR